MKKRIALIVSLCLLAALLGGCGQSKIETYSDEEMLAAEQAAEQLQKSSDPANAYAPDFTVCTVNGRECTWEEYYYWLNNFRQEIENSLGIIEDWDALNAYYTSNTNEEVVRSLAMQNMLQYQLILDLADKAGVMATEEEVEDQIRRQVDAFLGDNNGECSEKELEDFKAQLAEQGMSYELQQHIICEGLSESNYYNHITKDITDEQAIEWAEEQGYMYAKHILLLTVDSQTREPLSSEQIEAARTKAGEIWLQLDEAKTAADAALAAMPAPTPTPTPVPADFTGEPGVSTGEPEDNTPTEQKAFLALFDALMQENSEDTGLVTHPDGYMFLPGEMVEEFETAVRSLDPNFGLSQIVESSYGFHIILRQPLDCDTVLGQNPYGEDVTLRAYALNNIFQTSNQDAAAEATVEWTEGLDTIDLAALFASVK